MTSTLTAPASQPNADADADVDNTQRSNTIMLTCDYLVVGAGTACLSFVDTLITEMSDITVIIVDRNSSPGGHWTHSYPFVRLHQQSCSYGVNSLPLGKTLNTKKKKKKKKKNGKKKTTTLIEPYDMDDRATGKEVCEYYQKVVDSFPKDRVQTYFNATYEGVVENKKQHEQQQQTQDNDNNNDDEVHRITVRRADSAVVSTSNNEGQETHNNTTILHIHCKKVVQCESNVIVPAMRAGVPFPIDEATVSTIPLNELPQYFSEEAEDTDYCSSSSNRKHKQKQFEKYLVIGAGKSGVDAILYLLEVGHVDPEQITWIVSRSVWYLIRDGMVPNPKPGTNYWKRVCHCFVEPILAGNSAHNVFVNLERAGAIGRLNTNNFPQVFKGAILMSSELEKLRSLQNIITDRGRVTEITSTEVILQTNAGRSSSSNSSSTGSNSNSHNHNRQHSIPFSSQDTVVIDCMAEGYGYLDFDDHFEFFNQGRIRLGPLVSLYNPSFTSAFIAFLEAEFQDDDVKNSFLYFPRGPQEKARTDLSSVLTYLQMFVLDWYAQLKTEQQLNKYPPYLTFAFASRTNTSSPHHHGGIWNMVWAAFGPLRMQKKADLFIAKIEQGGYTDFPTVPLPGRTEADPRTFQKALRRTKQKKKKKK